jgi:hypothetical protein
MAEAIMTARITRFVLAAALAASLPGGVAFAQTAGHDHEQHAAQPPAATTAPPAPSKMAPADPSMMAMMQAQQKKLDELLATLTRMMAEMSKMHDEMLKMHQREAAPDIKWELPPLNYDGYASRNPH